ncbi:site-specific integrase, partial [Acinetobacter sp. ULE_I068]
MNKSNQTDSFDESQNTFTSFKGYEFTIDDQKWVLDINITIDISRVRNYEFSVQSEIVMNLAHFAKYSSSSHT